MSKIASLSTCGVPKENLMRYSPWSGTGVMALTADEDDEEEEGGEGKDGDGGDGDGKGEDDSF